MYGMGLSNPLKEISKIVGCKWSRLAMNLGSFQATGYLPSAHWSNPFIWGNYWDKDAALGDSLSLVRELNSPCRNRNHSSSLPNCPIKFSLVTIKFLILFLFVRSLTLNFLCWNVKNNKIWSYFLTPYLQV